MSPFPERDQGQCHYCKLRHSAVEAGGIRYCPNPACRGCGVEWFNRKLSSYKTDPKQRGYTVDPAEADAAALAYADALTDEPLAAHIRACIASRTPSPSPTGTDG